MTEKSRLTVEDVLKRYKDEDLPAFSGIELTDVNQVGLFGERPLDIAAVRGDVGELRALLEAGAEVNAKAERGNTALHEAVSQGHPAVVKLLVQYGADAKIKNELGETAIDIARRENTDFLALLGPT